jgi:Matrixin
MLRRAAVRIGPCMPGRLFVVAAILVLTAWAGDRPGDWTGSYDPCGRHMELAKRARMLLGVRFATRNRTLAVESARALDFWASVLEMDWYEVDSRECAVQIVDGHPGLFQPGDAARAQFPGTPSFQGWIAFNPENPLLPADMFVAAVHEFGHLLGLPHSTNPSSVMYFLRLDGPIFLDRSDLAALALRHTLRADISAGGVRSIPVARARDLLF